MFQNNIFEHFAKDHDYHFKLFGNYKEALNTDSAETTDIYNDLRNSIRRHNNEEEVLYSEYEPEDARLLKEVNKVRELHRQILETIDESYANRYYEELKELIAKCKKIMDEDREIEGKNLFPYFDKLLTEIGGDNEIIDDLDMYDPIDE